MHLNARPYITVYFGLCITVPVVHEALSRGVSVTGMYLVVCLHHIIRDLGVMYMQFTT